MSVAERSPAAILQRARRRRLRHALATVAPIALALAGACWILFGKSAALALLVATLAVLAALLPALLRPLDRRWLVARLDTALPALEDSSDLLLAPAEGLAGLRQLQYERVTARLAKLPPAQLRPAWPPRAIPTGAALALLIIGVAGGWWWWRQHPLAGATTAAEPIDRLAAPPAGPTRLAAIELTIVPPAYTGVAESRGDELALRAPVGSTLRWSLAFDPPPHSARLEFHDGASLPLQSAGDGKRWQAELPRLDRSRLYRIVLDSQSQPLADQSLQKLEVRPDRPPQIQVVLPDRALTLLEPGQKSWNLELEISDDYGLGTATLDLTLAQGSGENQTVQHSRQPLSPLAGGTATVRRYAPKLDLAALGMAAGDDLIVRIEALDRRAPQPQLARSSSLILRWPAELMEESGGMDGLVKKVLPAYFRSQRQIIIDTEALLAEQPSLPQEKFVIKSDTIGVDQRLLRLRYGQFLGEVVEGGPEGAEGEGDHDEGESHASGGEEHHDHGAEAGVDPSGAFGAMGAGGATAAFGHTHDIPEAATLLDPQTKEILRSALQEMWQAELHLRTAEPRKALPYERRALEYIKQVQQASRIYLARVGLELPPIDLSRRLSGDRSKVRPGRDPLVASQGDEAPIAAAWSALEVPEGVPDLVALTAWAQVRLQKAKSGESEEAALLGLIAAADAVQRDPTCGDCRAGLQAQLWPLLPRTEAGGVPRVRVDAAGAAYLEALEAAP